MSQRLSRDRQGTERDSMTLAESKRSRLPSMAAALAGCALASTPLAACAQATTPDEVRTGPLAPAVVITEPTGKGTVAVKLTATRIVHASVLLNFGGKYVLTDPWFTHRPGFLATEPLGFAPSSLPPLAAVVVSHEHYDHNDMAALAAAYPDRKVPIIMTAGGVKAARAAGFTDVRAVQAGDVITVDGITITAVPAKHSAPENSYVIESGSRVVFFGGDTLRIPEQNALKARFPRIDLALLPVNGLSGGGHQSVMNDVEAADLCRQLAPTIAVPIHYTFSGGDRKITFTGTAQGFVEAAKSVCPSSRAVILESGQPLTLDTAK